jgi:uncharacterized protein YjbI with pentapeptide repeats
MLKFKVFSRWSGDLQFTADIDTTENESTSWKLRLAVQWAVNAKADLGGANLRSANLGGADLGGADLRSADLGGADLRSANLRSANLGGANLRSANLRSANLRSANLGGADLGGADLRSADLGGADLRSADLRSADLGGANLRSANLGGADLGGADLRSADLGGADLRSANLRSANLGGANLGGAKNLPLAVLRDIRVDLFDILLRAREEVPGLLAALRAGDIDGSTYHGPCACLCGTIANVRGVSVDKLDFRDSSRPAERWFLAIRKGDTPENSEPAKITEKWIEEFQRLAA